MTKLGLTLSVLLSTTIAGVFRMDASAQPKPPPPKPIAFAQATTFEGCSVSWAFACGKRDAAGHTFGTAHERKHCERYTFQPNGTYSVAGAMAGTSYGTYSMIGGTVRMVPIYSDGKQGEPFQLPLSADGSTLGKMIRK